MIQGLYLAAQGMTPMMQKQDQIANNLANTNTTGFKQSGLFISTYQKYLDDDQQRPFVNREIRADEVYVDYSEGPLKKTGGELDMAIKGSGFFSVMTPGGVRYTRNGHFSLDRDGFLVTSYGARVMSTEGFVRVDRLNPVTITTDGHVLQEQEIKATLKIVDFEKPYRLLRDGDSNFRPQLPDNPVHTTAAGVIKQGYLEGSNVNLIRNMAQMISSYRIFEADQKALTAQDQTLDRAVNDVGRVT
jgi:flagellar basal-body rod protein FlgG